MQIDYISYNTKAKSIRQQFIIIHYTATDFKNSISKLTGTSVSSHYLIPATNNVDKTYTNNKLIVYSIVPEDHIAWHAGVSAWGNKTNLNDTSIGIEIVNRTNNFMSKPYTEEQIAVVISLCKQILAKYPNIKPTNILGHSDISVGRKSDPGPLFPWKKLHAHGIGAWYDLQSYNSYKKKFEHNLPKTEELLKKLYYYGYRYNGNAKVLLQAFQMHFRQSNCSGDTDVETAAIVYSLVDKYKK